MVVESIEGDFCFAIGASSGTANFPELTKFFYVPDQVSVQEYFAAPVICAIVFYALNQLLRYKAQVFAHRLPAGGTLGHVALYHHLVARLADKVTLGTGGYRALLRDGQAHWTLDQGLQILHQLVILVTLCCYVRHLYFLEPRETDTSSKVFGTLNQ